MITPVPKPQPKKKKRRKSLRNKTRLKSKYNPFPQSTKNEVWERQKGICAHPGCKKPITDYHHIKKKGMGSSTAPWIHDSRNCSGLCWLDHNKTENGKESTFWMYYWEIWGVIQFGWSGGQEITLDEWLDRNEYRINKANVDVDKILSLINP